MDGRERRDGRQVRICECGRWDDETLVIAVFGERENGGSGKRSTDMYLVGYGELRV